MPDNIDSHPYFDIHGIKNYAKSIGKDYDPNLAAADWWKYTREKLYFLVKLLEEQLDLRLQINYKERPNGQGGPGRFVFKDYVIAGFCPIGFKEQTLFIKLALHQLGTNPALDIEVDINTKVNPNRFSTIRPDNYKRRYRLPINSSFPTKWSSLLNAILPIVRNKYDEFCTIAGIPNELQTAIQIQMNNLAINTILYGPPGTGKTHRMQVDYVQLFMENAVENSPELIAMGARALADNHYWWQLVVAVLYQSEGALTVAQMRDHPLLALKTRGPNTDIYYYINNALIARADAASTALAEHYRRAEELFTKNDQAQWSLISKDEIEASFPNVLRIVEEYRGLSNSSFAEPIHHYQTITFHQKYSYEDFITGIRPVLQDGESSGLEFERTYGKFYKACLAALRLAKPEWETYSDCYKTPKVERDKIFGDIKSIPAKQYALFIDEINRANISAVFGELITLIEDDKRIGTAHELWVELPGTNEKFCVPPNLYIIGTMNTADKSIALIDIALRRRFQFVGMYPEYNKVGDYMDILRRLNEAIYTKKKSPDFFIGHAFFMKDGQANQLTAQAEIFNRKIIPLLMEYFGNKVDSVREVLDAAQVSYTPPSIANNYQLIAL